MKKYIFLVPATLLGLVAFVQSAHFTPMISGPGGPGNVMFFSALFGGPTTYRSVLSNQSNLTSVNKHAFEDYSVISVATPTGSTGYSSFDSYVDCKNTAAVNHVNGYQARVHVTGAGGVTSVTGFYSKITNSGPSTISIANNITIDATENTGGGKISYNRGIYIGDFSTSGTIDNSAIWIDNGKFRTGGYVLTENNTPEMLFKELDGGTDSKIWDFWVNGGLFQIRAVNDASNSAFPIVTISRTGFSSGAVSVQGSISSSSGFSSGSVPVTNIPISGLTIITAGKLITSINGVAQ